MQRAYVHAQCITGVIGPDHEVHPKVATDRRAVETVTRFRDSVLIAAAAVEVVLPNPQSTRRQFHRGPRRRRSTVRQRGGSASRRRDHGFPMGQHGPVGTKSRTSEAPRTSSRQHDSGLPCSKHNMPSCVPSCTTSPLPTRQSKHRRYFLFSSWLLQGTLAENASDASCASFPETRLDLLWAEDWPALQFSDLVCAFFSFAEGCCCGESK